MRLRVKLDGRWTAQEFALMFAQLDTLYADLLERKNKKFVAVAFMDVERARLNPDFGLKEDNLNVVGITYGSPGFSDFFGAAGLVSELRQFVQFLVEHFRTKDMRRLETEQIKIEVANARLALFERIKAVKAAHEKVPKSEDESVKNTVRRELDLLENDFGWSVFLGVDATLPDLDVLSVLCADGKIVGAETYEPDDLEIGGP